MKFILLCVAILVAILIARAARAIRSNAAMPSLDDPTNVTPPPARKLPQSDEREGPS